MGTRRGSGRRVDLYRHGARVHVMAGPCFLAVDKKKNPAYGGRALMKYRAFSTMTTFVVCSFFAPFGEYDAYNWHG